METPLTLAHLSALGFDGPYPHGEFYLFEEAHATRGGDYCVMCVAPPLSPGNWRTRWRCNWNRGRKLWSDGEFTQHVRSFEGLKRLIRASRSITGRAWKQVAV